MNKNKLDELTDSEIQMYLDGQLKGARKIDLENRIAIEPSIRERIIEYTSLDKKFKQKYGSSVFGKSTQTTANTLPLFFNWQIAVSFVMGVVISIITINFDSFSNESNFAKQAVVAHFKYSPEQHLSNDVRTLAFEKEAKNNNNFTPPDLKPVGLDLVGIRHLTLSEGKSVQLMYHDNKGKRYTVIITQNPNKQPPIKPGFYNTQLAQVSYWGNNHYNFAITGVNDGLDVRKIQPMIASNF